MHKHITAVAWPIAAGIAIGLAFFFGGIPALQLQRIDFLLNAIITCAATFSGFILTSVSILVGANTSAIMKKIREEDAFQELSWRYSEALVLGIVVILFFTALGAIIDESGNLCRCAVCLSAGILAAYLCSIFSAGYYLLSIICKINKVQPAVEQSPSVPEGEFR